MSVVSVDKDYERLTLTIVAEFPATAERVWQLWADPRRLERWWGPPEHPATVDRHELRPGGEVVSRGHWHVKAVDAPLALAFTDRFAGADGTPDPASPAIEARMELTESDGATRMTLRFAFESPEHMDRLRRLEAFAIVESSVAQMDALL